MILALLFFTFSTFAGFQDASESELYKYQVVKKPKKVKVKKKVKKTKSEFSNLADKLLDGDEKLLNLLRESQNRVILRKKVEKVVALTRIEGTVLNSVLAMNVKPSQFIVRLSDEVSELEGAELRCSGYSFQKRVPAKCDLLVMNESEYSVDISIWDLDGAEGMIADYFYSGEEKAFLTSSFASFLQGVLDVAKDRVTTPFGDVSRSNAKNKVLGGLVGVAGNVKDKVIESGEKDLTIAYVNSGKRVLVFFNQTLLLKERV